MDQERQRIEEDLRGVVAGEVLCDDASRALYATDGSLFEIWPQVIVRPRSVDDVAATVRWASDRGVPVHARGAGTSLTGDSLGPGVVIDCSRFLRRIIATTDETVRVQPGVVGLQLEEHLGRRGRTFGPDPAAAAVTTIGGMIGRNTSGSRFLLHGAVRGRLAAAQVVLADGSVVELEPTVPRPGPLPEGGSQAAATFDPAARVAALAVGVDELLRDSAEVIAAGQPAGRYAHGGYRLDDILHDGLVDLPRLICGAAGTLGIVTEATLRTVPADGATAVALFLFDSLEKAGQASLRISPLFPSACDLFDKRHLALARGSRVDFDLLIPPIADAGLLVEFTADTAPAASARLDDAIRRIQGVKRLCIDIRRADDAWDAAKFWDLSRLLVSTLHGVRGVSRPVPFVEDIVVPPEALPDFLSRLQGVLKRCATTAMIFGHAAHGQLHVRPYADPANPADREGLVRLAEAIYAEVVSVGGSIGGEQGLGLSRTGFFKRFYPDLARVFGRVKQIFDPAGLLNPGKIVCGRDDPPFPFRAQLLQGTEARVGKPSAPGPGTEASDAAAVNGAAAPSALTLPVLHWPSPGAAGEVDACNGCGSCRALGPVGRMCPRYREEPAEESSPRAKANLFGALLSGRLDFKSLSGDAVRTITETCFNCHQCRVECSAGVDVPALVMQLKGADVAENSLGISRWLLARADGLSRWGGMLAPLANAAIADPRARWLIERTVGVAQGRKLPRFTGNATMRWAARRGLTRPSRRGGPRVLYFLDTWARRHDPVLVEAFVAILEQHGVGVYIDPRQRSSGMPLIAAGDLTAARKLAAANVRILAEAVRLGYRIVCTEPAAVTAIVHDYPLLVEDDDLERVVEATCDATTYLWEMHRDGRLKLDFDSIAARVLYHAPCHLRSRAPASPAEHLLRLVPGLELDATERGCSGMAGSWGLHHDNHRASLRIGLGLVSAMRGDSVDAGATECSACRLQMEQGTTRPTVHPVKILAKSWGLLPGAGGLDPLLTTASGRLTTS